MFLTVTRVPSSREALDQAAAATGMTRVDIQQRLAGGLPRVLVVDADPSAIGRIQAALEAAGFGTLAFDPHLAPSDDDRIPARALELQTDAVVVVAGVGHETRHRVPVEAIALMQRAVRVSSRSRTVTTQERKLALGAALLTGGLKATRKVERTTTETSQSQEAVLLLHRRDGGPDVLLAEPRLNYRFLGADLQPSSFANFTATVSRLRALAPRAAFDDRASRAAFVTSLPACAAEPLDVALYLVQLLHAQPR